MSIIPISIPAKKLSASITSTDSSFRVNNILGWNGVALTTADLGSQHFVVFINDTRTLMEIIEIDPATIASASITILKRGLKFDGTETEVTANKLNWPANETTVLFGTDVPQLLNNFVDKSREQTITGLKTVPTPTSDFHIATKKYVDDNVNGGAVSHDRLIVAGNAGETVAAGELVYFDDTDNEWKLCDADTAASVNNVMLGIAQGAGVNGGAISGGVLIRGIDDNQTGLTAGALYYAANTAGDISSSTGTTERVVGFARTTTSFYFNPDFYYIPTANQKAAMVGTSGTPSSTNKFVTDDDTVYTGSSIGKKSLTAGATINGATLPVPVYQNKTDNEVYACDANDTAAYKFLGFAISNSTDGVAITVQFTGVVSGFTGLDEGEKYYVSDTVGTIANTPGTQEILVGVAISTTELLIQKGRRHASGVATLSDAGGGGQTQDTAVTLGFRPTIIRMQGFGVESSGAVGIMASAGTYVNGSHKSSHFRWKAAATAEVGSSSSYILEFRSQADENWRVTITAVTDTGFTYRATQIGASPLPISLNWEAEGEL